MYNPTYTCHRAAQPIVLTGAADDPQWDRAEVAVLTDCVTGEARFPATTARLLYDATHLYLTFQCQDTYVWGTFAEHDAPIFTEECVELFLCTSGAWRQYYEINVSPRNVTFDSFVLNGGSPDGERRMHGFEQYTCDGLRTMVAIDGEFGVPGGARGWSAEYAIPFTSIVGADKIVPEPGDAWRMNLYRIDASAPGKQEFFAWGTVGKIDFHQPWHFGTLLFA
jgi:hypothetical protein